MPRAKTFSDDQVLDAAMRVMSRKGPSDFTLADVAAVAGIAPATLVQRFGGKQGLVVRAVARDNQRFAAALSAAPRERSVEAVIDLFWSLTPGLSEEEVLADQLLWLRQDIRDPALNALARERSGALREAVMERLPAPPIAPELAARLVEAQWQGALGQWGVTRQGHLQDYVAENLAAWFELVLDRHEA